MLHLMVRVVESFGAAESSEEREETAAVNSKD